MYDIVVYVMNRPMVEKLEHTVFMSKIHEYFQKEAICKELWEKKGFGIAFTTE